MKQKTRAKLATALTGQANSLINDCACYDIYQELVYLISAKKMRKADKLALRSGLEWEIHPVYCEVMGLPQPIFDHNGKVIGFE